ncbi:MAG: transglycosylase SLT domain-containing protein [Gammaproteobacteria bacterium]
MIKQRRRFLAAVFWLLLTILMSAGVFAMDAKTIRAEAILLFGKGVDQDDARAYQLFCIAALQGDNESAYYLGWMRLNGYGEILDDAMAVGWFQLAAERGDAHSRHILEDLLNNVTPVQDSGCPLKNKPLDRAKIETWVYVLAPSYGLDANLLLAVIEVESRFNPNALSPKNARGLMQLLPATAKRFEVEDIWDPIENLMGGMAYLRWLLDRYDGDLNLSLSAYNAGEQIVDFYGGIPPYRETHYYVERINRIYKKAKQQRTTPPDNASTYVMSVMQ